MARVLRRDILRAARWASATARCDSCRPQRWEIAAAMLLAPTGAAGGRTWYVARALQRVCVRPRARCPASVGRWTWYASSRMDVGRGSARSHARLDPRPRRVFRYKRRSTMSRSRHCRSRLWVVLAHVIPPLAGERLDLLGYLDAIGHRRGMITVPSRLVVGIPLPAEAILYDLSDHDRLGEMNAERFTLRGRYLRTPSACARPIAMGYGRPGQSASCLWLCRCDG